MAVVRVPESDADLNEARQILWEYLQWANSMTQSEFGVSFDIESMIEDDISNTNKFFPPDGRIVLALHDGQFAGVACLKKSGEQVCEIKRLYVRPAFRGKAIGRELIADLVEYARDIGYVRIVLDSAAFMKSAHSLYRSLGFINIPPYAESEIPPKFHSYWVFMELRLK